MESLSYHARSAWAKSMRFGSRLGCHQIPERSFHVRGYQFPVCARCTGTFVGEIICLLLFGLVGYIVPPVAAMFLAFVMLFDWMAQQLGRYESGNGFRFITGVLGGLGCWSLLLHIALAIVRLFA